MKKRHTSVSEMVKHTLKDKAFSSEFEKAITDKRLAKTLFSMRCQHGLTQEEMAEAMGCSQGRISKLENSGVNSINVADLLAYARVFDVGLTIGFHKRMTAVECVKFHAQQIKRHLDKLASLAHKDQSIYVGVVGFFDDALRGILKVFEESFKKLPKPQAQPLFEVCTPSEESSETLVSVEA